MTPIFSHGRLRLYLLKLLEGGPKHGYELMRLLQERFQGLYAPSAGSVYPRLSKLEEEGLVSRVADGNRMAYALTGAGRAEVDARADELAALDREITASVADLGGLAEQLQEQISGSLRDVRRQLKEQARKVRAGAGARPEARGHRAETLEMLRRLEEFTAEARTAIIRADPAQAQVKAVAASLDATLRTLRDLLR